MKTSPDTRKRRQREPVEQQLHSFMIDAGRAILNLQKRVNKLENKERTIRGFGPLEVSDGWLQEENES